MCLKGHSGGFELAEFFRIDFQKKEIRATGENVLAVSPIRNLEETEAQIIMQGVENDKGWTTTVNRAEQQESGKKSTEMRLPGNTAGTD